MRVEIPLVLVFQSTPSVGRATGMPDGMENTVVISIHALRGEGDCDGYPEREYAQAFQSTPSVGRATFKRVRCFLTFVISIHALRGEGDPPAFIALSGEIDISIHALRGEGDHFPCLIPCTSAHFNPRPPWGGRPCGTLIFSGPQGFQSTPSVGRATCQQGKKKNLLQFQSTPSVGRATVQYGLARDAEYISIHALRGEGDV